MHLHTYHYPPIYLSSNAFVHPSDCHPSIHPSMYSLIHPCIHLFIHPSIHPLIYSSIHPPTHSSTHPSCM